MQMPSIFPDWMPGWLQLVLVVAAVLVGLAFLVMPFSVFGLKSRLDGIEARLDEMQAALRSLSQRLPEPDLGPYDTPALIRAASAAGREQRSPAAIPAPLPAREPEPPLREQRSPTLRAAARVNGAARDRAEPRLGRPR